MSGVLSDTHSDTPLFILHTLLPKGGFFVCIVEHVSCKLDEQSVIRHLFRIAVILNNLYDLRRIYLNFRSRQLG